MQSTNSVNRWSDTVRIVAIAAIPCSVFLRFAYAGDPYQPIRTLAIGLAAAAILATSGDRPRPAGPLARWAGVTAAILGALYAAAWFAGGVSSGLFGVHGRFAGALSGSLFLVVGAAGLTLDNRDVRTLARFVAITLAVQSMMVTFEVMTGAVPDATVGNRVLLGAWLALGIAVTFALALGERGRWRAGEYVAAGLGTVALGMVGSRGAWIGALAGVAVVLLAGRVRSKTLMTVASVVVLVVVGVWLIGGEAGGKLDPRSLVGGSAASRTEIWRGTASMIADHPALGVGPGRFLYEFPAYESLRHVEFEGVEVRADQAHSIPLQLAAESGIPAAIAALVLFGIAVTVGLRGTRQRSAAALVCLAGIAAFGGQGLFGISAVETDALAWLLGAAAIAAAGPLAPAPSRWWRLAPAGLALVVAATAGYYLVADATYYSGLARFSSADFIGSLADHERAIAIDPTVDVYRVGASDAAAYVGGQALLDSIALVERGLELEPMSYDLAIARARLLADAGAGAEAVADAYGRAVELYPLGLDVRHEAMFAYLAAGRSPDALALADSVLLLIPDDEAALQVRELANE